MLPYIIFMSIGVIVGGLVIYGFAKHRLGPGCVQQIIIPLALIGVVSGIAALLGALISVLIWREGTIPVLSQGVILGLWAIPLVILGTLISSFSACRQSRSHECLLNLG